MGEAFAPPVAGGRNPHQPGVLPVLHEADQHAILDQDVAARRRAFIIDGDRPAPVGDCAVVQHRHAARRDLLPHQPREGRGLLAVGVALKPVTDRLMQQDAGPAGAKRHIHHPRGRIDGAQVDQRDPERLARLGLPMVWRHQRGKPGSPATAGAAAFAPPVFLDDDGDVQPRHRPYVGHQATAGAKDEHLLKRGGNGRGNLYHAGVERAGIGVDLAQRLHLQAEARVRHRVDVTI